jgi:hypothetical protein
LVKTKVKEAMKTMSHTEQQKCRKVNNVIVKYVLVSPKVADGRCRKRTGGRAKEMFTNSERNTGGGNRRAAAAEEFLKIGGN